MEQTRLRAEIGFELERVIVLPGDMQVGRLSHDAGRAISLALIAFGFIFGGIPFQGSLSALGLVGDVSVFGGIDAEADRASAARNHNGSGRADAEVAFRGGEHAQVPILGDDGGPVAGQIDRGHRLGGRRRRRRGRLCHRGLACARTTADVDTQS